jgi:hypothetical protein
MGYVFSAWLNYYQAWNRNIKKYLIYLWGRLCLKCDCTRAESRFRLSAKWTSPFKSAGASVQSTTGSRGVHISGSSSGYTIFRGSVKSTGYALHSPVSPSLPLTYVTECHHISTGVFLKAALLLFSFGCQEVNGMITSVYMVIWNINYSDLSFSLYIPISWSLKLKKWNINTLRTGDEDLPFLHYNCARRMTQICVFNTRLFSLNSTLNYAIHRTCLRMVLLTDGYRNLTSLWINL